MTLGRPISSFFWVAAVAVAAAVSPVRAELPNAVLSSAPQSSDWGMHEVDAGTEQTKAPVLLIWRRETVSAVQCKAWLDQWRLKTVEHFAPANPLWKSTAWTESEQAGVKQCDRFPCDIKLARPEYEALRSLEPGARWARWLELVQKRVGQSGRLGYEALLSPAKTVPILAQAGLRPLEGAVRTVVFRNLPLDVLAGSRFGVAMKPTRQVLERRVLVSEHALRISADDLYSMHYFDGWGESHELDCQNAGVIRQAVAVEIDELKKGGFSELVSGGTIRRATRDYAVKYLQSIASQIKDGAITEF